jgi:hypothetical protein
LESPNPSLPQQFSSSYTWGDLFDFTRRQGARGVNASEADTLLICKTVSARAYTAFPWAFTLRVTSPGSIPAVNGVQDYPGPTDLYRLTRAWFQVPTSIYPYQNDLTPYTDPSAAAAQSAALAAAYVGAQGNGGGTPEFLSWPAEGFDIVKRLPPNRSYASYTQIRAITQQPNSQTLRLEWAPMVPASQPFSIECEYQPIRPPVNSLAESCWFPDDYSSLGMEGILYYLYRFQDDPRAGSVSSENGTVAYSGQLAVWMNAITSAASAEREGSVDSITPSTPLGTDSYGGSLWL